jgi:peptidoglycan/xylan/chitin deacetylase (PgdA/CDA1 family)
LPTSRSVVALTFDAGANADGVASITGTLQAEGVPATFFLTGRWVQAYPDLARSLGARFDIGNHSRTHPHLTELTDAQVRHEVTGAATAIQAATGVDPRPLFRFPFGDTGARTIAVVNGSGFVGIRWSVDTLGWKGTSGGQSVTSVLDRVLAAATAGEIVLMHVGSNPDDGSTLDADALPRVIASLRERGYSFVTVSEVLARVR